MVRIISELPHDKTNKMTVPPVKTESSLSAWRKLGSLATHSAHSEDSDQTGWMPRLIRLRWAHMPLCWFSHEAAHFWFIGPDSCFIEWFPTEAGVSFFFQYICQSFMQDHKGTQQHQVCNTIKFLLLVYLSFQFTFRATFKHQFHQNYNCTQTLTKILKLTVCYDTTNGISLEIKLNVHILPL